MIARAAASATQRLSLVAAIGFALSGSHAAAQQIEDDIRALATPQGRHPGSAGHAAAAEYIRQRFTEIGLQPAAPESSGESTFDHQLDEEPAQAITNSQLTFTPADGGELITLPAVAHWASGSESASGGGVFTGYSIVSGPNGYMSFATANDFTDKIAFTLRLEPMDDTGESLWTNGGGWSFRASALPKVTALSRRSAAGVVLVTPPGATDAESGELDRDPTHEFHFDVPVVMIDAEDADRIFAIADPQGRSTADLRSLADAEPIIQDLAGTFSIDLEAAAAPTPVTSIIGKLSGKGDLADETVLIVAHYDGPADLPAANANASGVAAMLRAAEILEMAFEDEFRVVDHARAVTFLALADGTRGADGLESFLEQAGADTAALAIILDTVGLSERAQINVAGVNSGEGLQEWLSPIFARSYLEIDATRMRRSGGAQLNATFNSGIPSLRLTTGFFRELNTPSDDVGLVDPESISGAAELTAEIALEAAIRPERFQTDRDAANIRQPDRPRRSVRLGVQPVFNDDEPGILIQRVFDQTAAAEAGLMQGDRIVMWNDEVIMKTEDFILQLGLASPGDTVMFTVVRDGETQEIEVKFQDPDD